MANKPATKPAPSTKPMAKDTRAVSFVAPTAISADVGLKAMTAFRTTSAVDSEIAGLQSANAARKYETLKALTQSFVKASMNDKTIDLGDFHSENGPTVSKLKTKLEVAVGIKLASKGEDGTDKFTLAPWTEEFLPQAGEDKTTEAWRTKENFRTNFVPVWKKAVLAAHSIVLKGLRTTEDKETGILMVEGPAIKERFNVDRIALDEKRTIKDGEKTIQLAKIPSYTELGRISAESAGKVVQTRVQSAAKLTGGKVTEKDVLAGVKAVQSAITKIKNFGDELATALESLQETIENALAANEGTNAS